MPRITRARLSAAIGDVAKVATKQPLARTAAELGTLAHAARPGTAADPAPAMGPWAAAGKEGQTIRIATPTLVRYGAGKDWIERIVTKSFKASNEFFGRDPAPGAQKVVEVNAAKLAPIYVVWGIKGG